ncbi:protein of unknown function [Bradyrhizobium vignae]|uniref:Uncharacterized protein n=1 Tax=Bradyrhizobium vignae TaxID=1549949 RepID=A0A2U3PTV5_9BRAD|nr:protein of unknown function [Bradyrhizobium vignae]
MIRPTLIRNDRVNRNNIPPTPRGNVAHADCKLMAKGAFAKLFLPQCTAHAQYRATMLDHVANRGSWSGPCTRQIIQDKHLRPSTLTPDRPGCAWSLPL